MGCRPSRGVGWGATPNEFARCKIDLSHPYSGGDLEFFLDLRVGCRPHRAGVFIGGPPSHDEWLDNLNGIPGTLPSGISMRRALAWVLCGVALSACSAIPRPSGSNRGTVSLESNPPGAEARLSSSGASCRTPCTLPVKVSDYNVTFALAGYTPRFIPIRVSIKREHWYSPEVTYVDPNPVMALLQPTPPPPGSK
jgi:hypothetical protein